MKETMSPMMSGRSNRSSRFNDFDFETNAINRRTDTLVYALGGLGEIGKNMYCFEHDDEKIGRAHV